MRRRGAKTMSLQEILRLLDARAATAEKEFSRSVCRVHASDLMSDVLAMSTSGALLVTSSTNIHVVRTAEVADLAAVCFVRDRTPDKATLALADEKRLPTMISPLSLFEACGRLYRHLGECSRSLTVTDGGEMI